jgi:C1A family cysteine protease
MNLQHLQSVLTYRGIIPVLQLKSGKQIALLPLEEPVIASAAVSQKLQIRNPALIVKEPAARVKPGITGSRIPGSVIQQMITSMSDHRSCQTAIRDQGDRGTCTAFASVAGIEAFEKCKKGVTADLSENNAYHVSMQNEGKICKSDPGTATYMTAQYLTTGRICEESQMPYTMLGGVPANDAGHVPAGCQGAERFGFTDTQLVMGTNFGGPAVDNANNPTYLESVINSGYNIVYGLYVAGTDWSDGSAESGVVDVQTMNGAPAPSVGGHAMLLVGFDHAGNYFIFKNSWSASHGHAGYFYLSYDYIRTYGKYGYIVKGVAD